MTKVVIAVLTLAASHVVIAQLSDEAKRIAEASIVLEEIMAAGDKAVPRSARGCPIAVPRWRCRDRSWRTPKASPYFRR